MTAPLSKEREQELRRWVLDDLAAEVWAELDRLRGVVAARDETIARAIYVAEHLHAMIPRDVWRDQGGDDLQGHYEGDYHAEKVLEEIKGWATGEEHPGREEWLPDAMLNVYVEDALQEYPDEATTAGEEAECPPEGAA